MPETPRGIEPITDKIAAAIADLVLRHRWLILALTVLTAALTGAGAFKLELVNNYRVYFGHDNPELAAFERFQSTYTKNDGLLFVLKPHQGDVFSRENLVAIADVTQQAWLIPFAIRVDSLTNFQHVQALGNEIIVTDLIPDPTTLSAEILAEKKAIALSEATLRGHLLALDASAAGIGVTLQFPEESRSEVPAAMAAARGVTASIRQTHPNMDIALTGSTALSHAFAEATAIDSRTLYPIMLIVLAVMTAAILRSVAGTTVTLAVIFLATISAVGVAGYAGWPVTTVSSGAPVVILTLAVADSIHILVTMNALMRAGNDKVAAIRESLRINFLAITVTSLTTMVGFLALNFADSPPFHHFGNITAIGILAGWIYSITFLPAALAVLPVSVATRGVVANMALMTGIANFVIRRNRAILVCGGVTAVSLIALIPRIELNDEWIEYFDQRTEYRRDAEFVRETLTGLYHLEYSVPAQGGGGINEPEYLANLDAFAAWIRDQNEVRHVYSYSDIAKRLNRNLHGDDSAWYRLPDDRKLAAQYLLLYELSLPQGADLRNRINIDKSATRFTAILNNVPTSTILEFVDRSTDWLRQNAPAYMATEATGSAVMFAHISERNIRSMLGGNIMALILITLIMVVTLRSWGLGGLSLIPNAVPILMAYGLWALLVGQVGMAAAAVSATSLGIVVDNSVHYLTKYLRARRYMALSRPASVIYGFETVGLAILANGVILIAGFSVLALSTFGVTAQMGMMTAIAIALALAFDLLVLPALLLGVPRRAEAIDDGPKLTEAHMRADPR